MSKEVEKKEEKETKHARVAATPAKKAPLEKPKRRAAMPMKQKPKMIRPSTVKGLIELIQNKSVEIQKGAADIRSSINEQVKENRDAVADFHAGVGVLCESILSQVKENKDDIAAFCAGVRAQMKENRDAVAAIFSGVETIQSSINEQMKENQAYIKDFYG
jgi:hypothetical protein